MTMFYRANDPWRRPAEPPRWLWRAALIVAVLTAALLLASYLDKQTSARAAAAPVTAAQVEELHRQLDDLRRQSDELGRRLEEDLRLLRLRRQMEERAAAAGTDPTWVSYAWDRAIEVGVDPALMLGLIDVESGWNARARNQNTNGTHDSGLGQTNSATLQFAASLAGIEKPDPFKPKDSIDMTVAMLAYLQRTAGPGPDRILTAYNRGETGLATYIASRGTARSDYSRTVLARTEG